MDLFDITKSLLTRIVSANDYSMIIENIFSKSSESHEWKYFSVFKREIKILYRPEQFKNILNKKSQNLNHIGTFFQIRQEPNLFPKFKKKPESGARCY